jgi:type I restriction enzyme S subunit
MTTETFFSNFGHLADAPNGVQKLRQLILQLAVQGKLVPQDPSDEPASVLLTRIRGEKERLAKEGEVGKIFAGKAVTTEEQIFVVPANWGWSRLDEICSYIQRGKGPTYVDKSDVPVVSQKCVQWSGFRLAPARFICPSTLGKYAKERFLRTGDLLWNSTGTGTIGRVNVYHHEDNPYEKVVADSHVTVVRPVFVNSRYVWIWLASPYIQTDLEGNASGSTNQVELATSVVKTHVIPLPPLEEQKRIVAKVDQLMALCNELETRQQKQQQGRVRLNSSALDALLTAREPDEFADHWQRISTNFDLLYDHPETIAKLRAAILQLAVQGKLVPQDPNDEPASVLLERVKAEKAKLISDKKVRGNKDVALLDTDDETIQVPDGWEKARIGEFSLVQGGKRLPNGAAFSSVPTTQIYIQVTNMKNGSIVMENLKYIDAETFSKINKYIIEKDDLYITIAGTIGDVGDVPEVFDHMSLTENAAKFVFRGLDKKFFLLALRSAQSQSQFREKTKQLAQPKLALHRIADAIVPIPPLEEQKRIVAKIDQLMKLCDGLESKLNQAQQHSEKLMEATVRQVLGTPTPQKPHTARAPAAPAASKSVRPARHAYQPAPAIAEPIAAETAVVYGGSVPETILAAMQPGQEYSRAAILAATSIREADWMWAIKQLKDQRRVAQSGEKRGARYRLK